MAVRKICEAQGIKDAAASSPPPNGRTSLPVLANYTRSLTRDATSLSFRAKSRDLSLQELRAVKDVSTTLDMTREVLENSLWLASLQL